MSEFYVILPQKYFPEFEGRHVPAVSYAHDSDSQQTGFLYQVNALRELTIQPALPVLSETLWDAAEVVDSWVDEAVDVDM